MQVFTTEYMNIVTPWRMNYVWAIVTTIVYSTLFSNILACNYWFFRQVIMAKLSDKSQ